MGNNSNQTEKGGFLDHCKEVLPEATIRAILEFIRILLERGMGLGAIAGACVTKFGISEHEAAKFVDKAKKKK